MILANNHAHLYESSLGDVSDVAEEIGGKQGGWYDYAKVNCVAGTRWIGVPHFIVSWAITYVAALTRCGRRTVEVHHRRHVRQGHPGHEARGRGRVGGRRAEKNL